ncbi:hypothetical protein KC19_4G006400 [Ceratodon purpureus]|uniref:Uncharacterized protein n=1 Tax=Ceratodon purpureus TaxID=3225 RepID=A0A8T0I6S9_CERPU|nr:hypothetical protein KC19_4G006400 [Ceratodon purpureus]
MSWLPLPFADVFIIFLELGEGSFGEFPSLHNSETADESGAGPCSLVALRNSVENSGPWDKVMAWLWTGYGLVRGIDLRDAVFDDMQDVESSSYGCITAPVMAIR